MKSDRLPTYFISHGGGPWPWLKKEMPFYGNLEASLQTMVRELGEKPRAVLVVSGHWEEADFAVMAAANPGMLYDYGGFPEHTYHIQYPAPGAPELALRVSELISKAGLESHLDDERDFDHGTFVPLFVMYPNAEVPVFQVSIRSDYDPEAHLKLGRALAPLRDEGVLIVASGLSYHNLRNFFQPDKAAHPSREFDQWLGESLLKATGAARNEHLQRWNEAPSARAAHPREDHLIPLMVAVGAAENEEAHLVYHEDDFMVGLTVSSYRFVDFVR